MNVQYKFIINPIDGSLQVMIDPASIPGALNNAPVPGREGNLIVFGPKGTISDSGYYLNEQGEMVKVEGGYMA